MTDRKAKSAGTALGRIAAALAIGGALVAAPLGALAQDAAKPADAPAAAAPATPPAAPAAPAQPDPNAVVANVGDETITEADLGFAAEDLAQELQQVPPDQQRAFLTTVLIDMKVMAQAAKEQGMDKTDIFKRRLAYLEERALRRAYFADKVATAVTPDTVKAAYDKFVAGFTPQDEVHAEHILVSSEDDAKAIKEQLDKGANFEELAKQKSTDPSAKQNGGDLGFFGKDQMVKPFADKAFSMEAGQISDPVQSQFGWHIIKVVEKRKSSPPTLDQLQQQIGQQLMFKSFDDEIAKLKSGLKIDIPDEKLAAAVKAQNDEAAAASEKAQEAPPAQ